MRTLLRRCLQKDPQRRLRDIGDARMELEEPPSVSPAEPAVRPTPRRWLYAVAWLLPSTSSSVAISRDGTRVAFVGARGLRTQVYFREIAGLEVKPVPGTTMGNGPFFSPDGQWLGFRHNQSLTEKKVALSGGAPVTIGPVDMFAGANWEADDTSSPPASGEFWWTAEASLATPPPAT
ncbi:MAG: PD40 domain-containing protein [Acidobacteria bacterium]|nr:PD40 domain-containing protein [Acidobacteriota bacterium]